MRLASGPELQVRMESMVYLRQPTRCFANWVSYSVLSHVDGSIPQVGSIGAGFFVGSGGALLLGGPASLLLGFGITGLMVLGTVQALGELTVMYPVNGAFHIYTTRLIDPA